jgi:hypothetical protein
MKRTDAKKTEPIDELNLDEFEDIFNQIELSDKKKEKVQKFPESLEEVCWRTLLEFCNIEVKFFM